VCAQGNHARLLKSKLQAQRIDNSLRGRSLKLFSFFPDELWCWSLDNVKLLAPIEETKKEKEKKENNKFVTPHILIAGVLEERRVWCVCVHTIVLSLPRLVSSPFVRLVATGA
jgi:hypothetical protein